MCESACISLTDQTVDRSSLPNSVNVRSHISISIQVLTRQIEARHSRRMKPSYHMWHDKTGNVNTWTRCKNLCIVLIKSWSVSSSSALAWTLPAGQIEMEWKTKQITWLRILVKAKHTERLVLFCATLLDHSKTLTGVIMRLLRRGIWICQKWFSQSSHHRKSRSSCVDEQTKILFF